jgi:hypothetical protein
MVGDPGPDATVGRPGTVPTAKPYRTVKDLPTVELGGLP